MINETSLDLDETMGVFDACSDTEKARRLNNIRGSERVALRDDGADYYPPDPGVKVWLALPGNKRTEVLEEFRSTYPLETSISTFTIFRTPGNSKILLDLTIIPSDEDLKGRALLYRIAAIKFKDSLSEEDYQALMHSSEILKNG